MARALRGYGDVLVLPAPPHVTRALRELARVQSEGEDPRANKFTPEDCATEILEVGVLERFEDVFGMPVHEFFRRKRRRKH